MTRGISLSDEAVKRGEQAENLMLAGLASAGDPLSRQARQLRLVYEIGGRRPCRPGDVHVEKLQSRGGYEILPSAKDAGSCWASQRLAPGIRDKVAPLGHEAFEISRGRQLGGGIDDQGDVVGASHGGNLGQRWLGSGAFDIEDRSRTRAYSGLVFPWFGVANARAG